MATPTNISKPYKFLNGGPLDWWQGPWSSVAQGCSQIPNQVDTFGINFREGKSFFVREDGLLIQYWWPSVDYSDSGVRERLSDVYTKEEIDQSVALLSDLEKYVEKQRLTKPETDNVSVSIVNGKYINRSGFEIILSRAKYTIIQYTAGDRIFVDTSIFGELIAIAIFKNSEGIVLGTQGTGNNTSITRFRNEELIIPEQTDTIIINGEIKYTLSVKRTYDIDFVVADQADVNTLQLGLQDVKSELYSTIETISFLAVTIVSGAYAKTDGTIESLSSKKYAQFDSIDPQYRYVASSFLRGTVVPLVVYRDYNGDMIEYGPTAPSNTIITPFTDIELDIPYNAVSFLINGESGSSYPISVKKIDTTQEIKHIPNNLDKIASDVSEINTAIRQPIDIESILSPSTTVEGKYINRNSGNEVTLSSKRYSSFNNIDSTKKYLVSTGIRGSAVSLVVYKNSVGSVLGSQQPAPSDSVVTTYTDFELSLPNGVSSFSVNCENGYQILVKEITTEVQIIDFASKSFVTEGFSKGILEISAGFAGDSITARANRWVDVFCSLLKISNKHNVAVGSSRWSKSTGVFNGETISSQNYDDPNWVGISSGFEPTTDPLEIQKRYNNYAGAHIDIFISEVTAGTFPEPKVFIFAYGTNDDQNLGDANSALSGKTIDRDNTYTMANSARYCIQRIQSVYPECSIFVSMPLQTGSATKNSVILSKIDILKSICKGLSVPTINCYEESGINEKFESSSGGSGRYLQDGLHPNVEGGIKQGKYVANSILTLMFK